MKLSELVASKGWWGSQFSGEVVVYDENRS